MSDMTEFISILQNVLEELEKAEKLAQKITYDGEKHLKPIQANLDSALKDINAIISILEGYKANE